MIKGVVFMTFSTSKNGRFHTKLSCHIWHINDNYNDESVLFIVQNKLLF